MDLNEYYNMTKKCAVFPTPSCINNFLQKMTSNILQKLTNNSYLKLSLKIPMLAFQKKVFELDFLLEDR